MIKLPAAVPIAAPRQVVLVAFKGVRLLDVAGPADVFAIASEFCEDAGYAVRCLSSSGGAVATSSGVCLHTLPIGAVPPAVTDTLIVAGGGREGVVAARDDAGLRRWFTAASVPARRVASVCSGAFLLAEWGLLEQRRATTHWSAAETLRRGYPNVGLESDALYVQDGKVWTSGGVTAGIDMCLAMVEADHGRWLAARVAQQLVLSGRRVGNQAQYSTALTLHGRAGRYAELADWIRENLCHSLTIGVLAAQAGESERTFCRRFATETGATPAAFVEALRLQAAKQQLQAGASVKTSARAGGFKSDEHLARVFKRRLDMTPMEYRRAHHSGSDTCAAE